MAGPQTLFSTGLRNTLLKDAGLKEILGSGGGTADRYVVNLFGHQTPSSAPVYNSTTIPATADAATSGVLIVTIEAPSAAALAFLDPSNGVIQKDVSQDWFGTTAAPSGGNVWVPVYWRLQKYNDANTLSTTDHRIQGNVGQSGDFSGILATQVIAGAVTQYIDSFVLTLPSGV